MAATISLSPNTRSACFIHSSSRSLTSSAINPSPKVRCARRVSIMVPGASRRGAIRPQQRVVELADLLERFLELVVIAEPAAHLVNLFAAQAELASTATGVADGQNPQRVPAAAGADRAAAGVAHGPLEQRAAQNLPCHRQLGDERLARLDNLVSRHLYK